MSGVQGKGFGSGYGGNWIIWLLIILLFIPYFGGGFYGCRK